MISDGAADADSEDPRVQDRRSTKQAKLPWVVRYVIDGRHRSESFEADRYRGLLLQAFRTAAGSTMPPMNRSHGRHRWPTCAFMSGHDAG